MVMLLVLEASVRSITKYLIFKQFQDTDEIIHVPGVILPIMH